MDAKELREQELRGELYELLSEAVARHGADEATWVLSIVLGDVAGDNDRVAGAALALERAYNAAWGRSRAKVRRRRTLSRHDERGVAAIVALQKAVGVTETRERALKGWREMDPSEREQTLLAHEAMGSRIFESRLAAAKTA
jgi:hypothetical protein